MMKHEFVARTNYEPADEEYHYIEESYYEFNGNKDEFCKQWKKDYKDGHWAKELELRRMLDVVKADMKEKVGQLEETINFYRPYFERAYKAEKKAAILECVSENLVNIQIQIRGRYENHECVKVTYIPKSYNGQFEFINIVRKSGLTTSVKLEDLENIRRI